LLQRYCPQARQLLELGCGSGGHALKLVDKGMQLHGVDMSQDMLDMANAQKASLPEDQAARLHFSQSDIRQLQLGRRFDSAMSLFHVISYLPTLEDILTVFDRVNAHLEHGGVFIFDTWYAPAVLTQKPEV